MPSMLFFSQRLSKVQSCELQRRSKRKVSSRTCHIQIADAHSSVHGSTCSAESEGSAQSVELGCLLLTKDDGDHS